MEDPALRLRTKILIVILMAVIYVWAETYLSVPAASGRQPSQADMDTAYREFNEVYFNNELPKDVVIDWAESKDMASTVRMADGRFHLAFNEKYNQASRAMRESMLHEQCHVRTWRSLSEMTAEEILTNQHGRRWRTCMLQLDIQGAFRREIIDYYEGN